MLDDLQVPPLRTTSYSDRARQGQALAQLVSAGPVRRRVTRTAFAVGTASVVVATMGARAAYIAFAPVTDHTVVHCYTAQGTAEKDLGTDTNYQSGAPADAIAACTSLWQAGVLQLGKAQAQPQQGPGPLPQDQPVPALVACTLHGEAAVFPGDPLTCQHLGLPVLKK
jgi:hypothetical protein